MPKTAVLQMTTWGWFKKQVSGKMVNILTEINMFTTCKKKATTKTWLIMPTTPQQLKHDVM